MQKSYDAGVSAATSGGITPQHGQRRRHNFGDRVYKLSPEETPFFAYLNAVGKYPTDDPVFRVLEDRAPIKWADRLYAINSDQADVIVIGKDQGDNWTFGDEGGSASNTLPITANAGELIVGQVVQAINFASELPQQLIGKITAVGTNTCEIQTVQGAAADVTVTEGAGDDDSVKFQVIGSAFGEGTLSPASYGYEIEDNVGYTQIFKTTAHMSHTEMATVMRGYASEWDRTWAMKLREHKVDIERAFLFNNLARYDNIQYSDGIIGHILKSGASAPTDDSALAYASGKPYVRIVNTDGGGANNEATYDRFLKDFEIIFAPERGGASQKFCMASMPVVTYLNQLKGGFMDGSANTVMRYNLDFSQAEGGLGHSIMKIDTVHGSLAVVKNPLLKGSAASMMVGVDLDNVKYRPLVGNGVNRDTYIDTNVQAPDEDGRKDQILTEAGLEVCLPESHFLYNFVNGSAQLG